MIKYCTIYNTIVYHIIQYNITVLNHVISFINKHHGASLSEASDFFSILDNRDQALYLKLALIKVSNPKLHDS